MSQATVPLPSTRLRELFHPRSIALIGATDRSRWSTTTFQNLKNFGFTGPIYCVNPNYTIIHGEPSFKSLADIQQQVDLAFIMVPTHLVYQIVKEAAAIGIRNAVILTSGFSELGAGGLALEQELLTFAQQHDLLILGPNGNGFVNAIHQIIPYGLPVQPPLLKGPVGVVLQSGALASAMINLAQARHIGLSLLVSMGNETMLSTTDVIDYLIEDDVTQVIVVFLETIRQPAIFQHIAHKALTHHKPIVALKVGKSEISARSAKAHTGALVGDDAINDAIFKQSGIIRVNSLEDLLITAEVLAYSKPLLGQRMGLVTPSGGACDILADRAHEEGILLPEFSPKTVENLQHILPEFSTIHNPLDVTGYIVVDRTLQQQALQIVIEDPGFDFIVYLSEPPRTEPLPSLLPAFIEQYKALGTMIRQARLPIIVLSNTCTDLTPFAHILSNETGLHFVGGMEHGMRALGCALWWQQTHQKFIACLQSPPTPISPMQLPERPSGTWSEYTARIFLQQQGVPVVPGILVTNVKDAINAAQTLGYPVALKIQSAEIIHKSDIGGVSLDIANADEVSRSFDAIMRNITRSHPDAPIDGILVNPMRPTGIELLVGIIDDASWGQVLVIGLGGIWTEVFKDTSVRVLPIQREEISTMLRELRGASLLQGMRGQPPIDIERVAEQIFHISQIAQGLQAQLESLEINPLLLHGSNIEALDALMTWKAQM